ncbi:hypothetical protein [Vibrio sp. M260118]|uniref:hypothetical protein n=1 Tax=Vibrio sp. M260118 TaxID=3020896 RepID=UPI002F425F22
MSWIQKLLGKGRKTLADTQDKIDQTKVETKQLNEKLHASYSKDFEALKAKVALAQQEALQVQEQALNQRFAELVSMAENWRFTGLDPHEFAELAITNSLTPEYFDRYISNAKTSYQTALEMSSEWAFGSDIDRQLLEQGQPPVAVALAELRDNLKKEM